MKLIKTVAGVIRNEKGEVLCTLRDVGKYEYVSLKWEFPGGKTKYMFEGKVYAKNRLVLAIIKKYTQKC